MTPSGIILKCHIGKVCKSSRGLANTAFCCKEFIIVNIEFCGKLWNNFMDLKIRVLGKEIEFDSLYTHAWKASNTAL